MAVDNPRKEPDWVAFEYTGVPPGRNLRANVWFRAGGSLKVLYEDWGPRDENNRPLGRPIGEKSHRIQLVVSKDSIQVFEDGSELFSSANHQSEHDQAFV